MVLFTKFTISSEETFSLKIAKICSNGMLFMCIRKITLKKFITRFCLLKSLKLEIWSFTSNIFLKSCNVVAKCYFSKKDEKLFNMTIFEVLKILLSSSSDRRHFKFNCFHQNNLLGNIDDWHYKMTTKANFHVDCM